MFLGGKKTLGAVMMMRDEPCRRKTQERDALLLSHHPTRMQFLGAKNGDV